MRLPKDGTFPLLRGTSRARERLHLRGVMSNTMDGLRPNVMERDGTGRRGLRSPRSIDDAAGAASASAHSSATGGYVGAGSLRSDPQGDSSVVVPGHCERRLTDHEVYTPPFVGATPDGNVMNLPAGVRPPNERQAP